MKSLIIALALFFVCLVTVEAQQNPLRSCEIARDTARTRITIVSNSRVQMEEDLAALSVTLRLEREAMRQMETELTAALRNKVRLLEKKDESETKGPESETKAAESETKHGGHETKAEKTETAEGEN